MNTKEKTYVMALAALTLIGLSTAWAAYSKSATISATLASFSEPQVEVIHSSLQMNGVGKTKKWYYASPTVMFNISASGTNNYTVKVTLVNIADVADDFNSLDIHIELINKTGGVLDQGVISLESGDTSVLLNATNVDSDQLDLSVRVSASGHARAGSQRSVSLTLVCEAETGVLPS